MINLSEKELLKSHFDCLFIYEKERMVCVNEPWGSTAKAPLLIVGRTNQGEIVYRFGQRSGADFVAKAEQMLSHNIFNYSMYAKALNAKGGSQEFCYYFPSLAKPNTDNTDCRLLTAEDSAYLKAAFQEGEEEIETAQPYVGYFDSGEIVSICRSVRIGRSHEAGIETLPSYRRQGYAQAVLNCWTYHVQQQGNIPLYSAETDNEASLCLAQKAGYILYAETFEIW